MANDNLSAGQVLPGFFGEVDYNSGGAGVDPNRRALIWGIKDASGQASPNIPRLPESQQEADDLFGAGSDLAAAFAAAVSQPESQDAEVWCLPVVAPTGGVAAIYKLKVFGPATRAGSLQLRICSIDVPVVGYASGDSAATIATALQSAIQSIASKLPIGTVTVSTDEVTIPLRHKGVQGEDFPMRCNITPGTGVSLSPGQLVLATNAIGAGSIRVDMGALVVSTTLAGGETPAAAAALVADSFNAEGAYPLSASVVSSTVNLFFRNDMDVRRLSASILTSTGMTADLGSGVTDGTGSPTSLTYAGTPGTGVPSISASLTNLDEADPFRSWAQPWLDTTLIGLMATHIENKSDGSIGGQKQQVLSMCSFETSSVAGAIGPAVSPNLTTTAPHYAILRAQDCPIPGMWFAARIAVARAAAATNPGKNYNGFRFRGNERSPILGSTVRPSKTVQNSDLRTYGLSPVVVGPSGYWEVVKGRTTSLASDRKLHAWSVEAQCAFYHQDLVTFLRERFEGGSLVQYSEPKTAGIFDEASFEQAVRERMRFWEELGIYDGAERLASYVKATRDLVNPYRMNVRFPMSPVLDLDQVVFSGLFQQPAA